MERTQALRERLRDDWLPEWWRIKHDWQLFRLDGIWQQLELLLVTGWFAYLTQAILRGLTRWSTWVCWTIPITSVIVFMVALHEVMFWLRRHEPRTRRPVRHSGFRRLPALAGTVILALTPLWLSANVFKSLRNGLHLAGASHSPWRWLWILAVLLKPVAGGVKRWPTWSAEVSLRLELRRRLASAGTLATDAALLAVRYGDSKKLTKAVRRLARSGANAPERCEDAAWAFNTLAHSPDLAPRALAPYWEQFFLLSFVFRDAARSLKD